MAHKKVCFYHGSDLDGFCSGAIVAAAHYWKGVKLVPIDYGHKIPWELVDADTEVWMVDFCFSDFTDMETMNECSKRFVWIDHHKSAIDKYEDWSKRTGEKIEGFREIGRGACELTWEYFFPGLSTPRAVHYLSVYDVWEWKSVPGAREFNMGMRGLKGTNPIAAEKNVDFTHRWNLLLQLVPPSDFHKVKPLVDSIVRDGEVLLNFQSMNNAQRANSACYEIELSGIPMIAANTDTVGSAFFDDILDKYPKAKALCSFHIKNDLWRASLYKIDGRDSPDLSEIARRFGGGGHVGAAGFIFTNNLEVFRQLIGEQNG